jgi:hypothetical protein
LARTHRYDVAYGTMQASQGAAAKHDLVGRGGRAAGDDRWYG